jgi:hypothetical protein
MYFFSVRGADSSVFDNNSNFPKNFLRKFAPPLVLVTNETAKLDPWNRFGVYLVA